MPFDSTLVISIIAFVIGIAVWARTKRIGPVVGVMFAAFVLVALADRSILSRGGQAVGDFIGWIFDTMLTF